MIVGMILREFYLARDGREKTINNLLEPNYLSTDYSVIKETSLKEYADIYGKDELDILILGHKDLCCDLKKDSSFNNIDFEGYSFCEDCYYSHCEDCTSREDNKDLFLIIETKKTKDYIPPIKEEKFSRGKKVRLNMKVLKKAKISR